MLPSVKDTVSPPNRAYRGTRTEVRACTHRPTPTPREFADIVGESQLLTGERIGPDYHHDEALVGEPVAPRFVARPQTAEQVAALLAAATRAQMPVTTRGSGTGLSAAARPCPNGLPISFERMNAAASRLVDCDVRVCNRFAWSLRSCVVTHNPLSRVRVPPALL
jgi:FAD binding domain